MSAQLRQEKFKGCWRCGDIPKKGSLTDHHAIPKWMKPIANVVVPLCVECHRLVHIMGEAPEIISKIKSIRKNIKDGQYEKAMGKLSLMIKFLGGKK